MKSYKRLNDTYDLTLTPSADIKSHMTSYMDYISLSTNTVFDDFELDDLTERMESAVNTKSAYTLLKNGIDVGFMYLQQVSKHKHFVVVLHTYDVDSDPIPKLLLVILLYDVYPGAWYLPKDWHTMANISLLNPCSYGSFRRGTREYVKMLPTMWEDDFLTYLQLEEIVWGV